LFHNDLLNFVEVDSKQFHLFKAKKSLGQHFLHEIEYARRIATAVRGEHSHVTEVGPGQGMLTQFLVGRFDVLLLIEKDTVLVEEVRKKWGNDPGIYVHEDDFLRFDLSGFWGNRQFSLVGNFPYNISSQIVFKMLEMRNQIPELVGMFQYEMAKRIVSGPGNKDYGILSVLTAAFYHGRILFKVPAGAFKPPPKVESAVIRLERKDGYVLPCEYQSLRTVVRAAFGQRRKMLRNSLHGLLPEEVLHDDALFQRRPEQMSVDDFLHLAIRYEASRKDALQ
jgi:16S rRNA (adenine1518-N6/adenine1519-N6)-dimethyltransferase